jgi:hypothetical protein
VGRIYYVFGIGAFERKVDWPALLLNFLGAASLFVLLIWLLSRLAILIGITFKKWKEGSCVGWTRPPDANASGGVPTIQSPVSGNCDGGHGAKAPLPTPRAAGGITRRTSCCAAALTLIFALTQMPPAYSLQLSAPGTSNSSNCSASNSDFEADLRRLAETLPERADIPSDFIQKYFVGCKLEKAREFLNKSGFRAGKPEPELDASEPKKVIPRTIVAEKTMRGFRMPGFGQLFSLTCRIILENDASNGLSGDGFCYFDGNEDR